MSTNQSKVMIVAFDGMDFEEMRDMDLPNIVDRQEDFGKINLDMLNKVVTSEAFVTFLTGKSYKSHGCTGLKKINYPKPIQKFEDLIDGTLIDKKTNSLRDAIYSSVNSIRYEKQIYTKNHYDQDTIIEKLGGKPLFVPGYNPEMAWSSGFPSKALENGFTIKEANKKAWELTDDRIDRFKEISFDFWNLIILHLHQPDYSHHYNGLALESEYQRCDEFAREILDRFSEDWTVIFMSDHGLPTSSDHNKNAFYSCNRQIFEKEEPKLTDFYELVVELVE